MAEKDTSFMDAIRESFEKTPTPFNETASVTDTMTSGDRLNEILNKSRDLMNNPRFNQIVENRTSRESAGYNSYGEQSVDYNSTPQVSIMESFNSMPPIADDNFEAIMNQTSNQMSSLREQVKHNPPKMQMQQIPQVSQIQSSPIDYSLLKMIINECVKENMKTIQESLNESTIRGLKLNPNGVIQVLDKKGNLYEGQLKLKAKKS